LGGNAAIREQDGDAASPGLMNGVRPDFRIDDYDHGRLNPVKDAADYKRKIDWEIKGVSRTVFLKTFDGYILTGFCYCGENKAGVRESPVDILGQGLKAECFAH